MAPISPNITTTFLILFILSSDPVATLTQNSSHHHDQEAICNTTPHPTDCLSNLPNQTFSDPRNLSLIFLHKSLSSALQALSLVSTHLQNRTLPGPTLGALQDCHLLAQLSLDSISRTDQFLNSTHSHSLDPLAAEDLETLLSAVLTNQETCLEGLDEVASPPSLRELLRARLEVGKRLYSVSLALFKRGWVDKDEDEDEDDDESRGKKQRRLVEGMSGLDLGGVLVSGMVVVSQNGSGNYTTISEAVNVAPNNSAMMVNGRGNTSYFVIYVRRGVYEEYVSIETNKQNLMMIGDGINQTIITGNRSVVDGWTTYNSATFGNTVSFFINFLM